MTKHRAWGGAYCHANSDGPLCAKCKDKTAKVKGVCIDCPGVSSTGLASRIALLMAMGAFLYKQARRPSIPVDDMKRVWFKVVVPPVFDHEPTTREKEQMTAANFKQFGKVLVGLSCCCLAPLFVLSCCWQADTDSARADANAYFLQVLKLVNICPGDRKNKQQGDSEEKSQHKQILQIWDQLPKSNGLEGSEGTVELKGHLTT